VLGRAAAAGKPSDVIAGEIATGLDPPAAALSLTEAYGKRNALHCAGSSVTRATAEVLAVLAARASRTGAASGAARPGAGASSPAPFRSAELTMTAR
jgi:hypothetical protein